MLFLFYIWCASVAADQKTYIFAAASKEEAFATVPLFMRQDWDVHYASFDEAVKLGCVHYKDNVVVFEGKFFEYNNKTKRLEYDSDVNYTVHPELWND